VHCERVGHFWRNSFAVAFAPAVQHTPAHFLPTGSGTGQPSLPFSAFSPLSLQKKGSFQEKTGQGPQKGGGSPAGREAQEKKEPLPTAGRDSASDWQFQQGSWPNAPPHYFLQAAGHITISREDAHQTALAYAKFALFLHTLLELVDSIFVLKKHRLTLSPDFTRETSVYDVSFRIRFRPLFAFLTGGEILLALLGKASKNSKKSVSKGGSYESAASHR
jgi:hypothetical protein